MFMENPDRMGIMEKKRYRLLDSIVKFIVDRRNIFSCSTLLLSYLACFLWVGLM